MDTRARGTRTGPIGQSASPVTSNYLAPPESMSFTFDNDGFCTRITAAATLDPLLGNTGLLGGVYGLLYATGTPENPLKVRCGKISYDYIADNPHSLIQTASIRPEPSTCCLTELKKLP